MKTFSNVHNLVKTELWMIRKFKKCEPLLSGAKTTDYNTSQVAIFETIGFNGSKIFFSVDFSFELQKYKSYTPENDGILSLIEKLSVENCNGHFNCPSQTLIWQREVLVTPRTFVGGPYFLHKVPIFWSVDMELLAKPRFTPFRQDTPIYLVSEMGLRSLRPSGRAQTVFFSKFSDGVFVLSHAHTTHQSNYVRCRLAINFIQMWCYCNSQPNFSGLVHF